MKKKVLSLFLAVLMALSAVSVAPFSALAAWDGTTKKEPETADGVYQIGTAEELAWFADYVNQEAAKEADLVKADAVLTADIDLAKQPWTPIGNTSYIVYTYAGTFDGQNHTVSNLKISAASANHGLFGTANTATIKNLKVQGVVSSTNVVGGIIGKLQTGTIENCSFSGSVTSTGSAAKGYVGGIVATVGAKDAVIRNCCNTADISGTYAGGIVGYNKNKGTIEYCYNTGTITGSSRSGGIAGQQSSGAVSYCYNIGEATNGIAGFCSATVTECYMAKEDAAAPGGTATGYKVITTADALLAALNSGTEQPFVADTDNQNGGYPLLSWQVSEAAQSVPVETVNILGNAETGATLTAQALGADDATATNVSYQWAMSADGEVFTALEGATNNIYAIPDTADYAGKYFRVTVTGEEESTATATVGPIAKSAAVIHGENEAAVASVKAHFASLDGTVIKEAAKLDLPETMNGCALVWESSQPEVIAPDGTVTLPEKNIAKVTLTLTVTAGDVSDNAEYAVSVFAQSVDPQVYLDEALAALEWSFPALMPQFGKDTNILTKFNALLKAKGFEGVIPTINSTSDEAIISQNGKITYPAKPESSFSDGKQVTVLFNLTVGEATAVYPTSTRALLVEWDKSDMEAALAARINEALTEDAIRGDNASLNGISSDLTLPAYLDGDRTSFAWVTWESDSENLVISNENRESGADSIYNPYVGKVVQDSEAHTVTLKATAANPATGVTAEKTFTVEIAPAAEGTPVLNEETMQKLLDCYTAEKLMDFNSKKAIDPSAVTDDIQLVLPKNVVSAAELAALEYGAHWDYWNYRFTVESSDSDVIEINNYHAFVYRPLGDSASADKTVTLTVTMTSKEKPSLSVKKEISVTVAHLDRAALNAALDLMDKAKAAYANALLGTNADAYTVIDSLSPFKEIVADGDGVAIHRTLAEMEHTGIIVDAIPGWESQESWRSFKSSNPDLLANETLNLNATPAENTFVKIESVLTDETFGKYYNKYKDNKDYDAEALKKLEQLYQQSVSAYVLVLGGGSYTSDYAALSEAEKAQLNAEALNQFKAETDKAITVTFTLLGLDNKVMIPPVTETSFTAGATVFDVFKKVLADYGIEYTARGSYVSSIGGLSEFDYGENSGWMYTVGDVYVNSYMNAQVLKGNEDIVVRYVKDFTKGNDPEEPEPQPVPETVTLKKPAIKKVAVNTKRKTAGVTFKAVKNATDYQIRYRKAGAKKWKTVSTNGKTAYTLKKLKKAGAYDIQVRAVAASAKSKWSKVKRVYIRALSGVKVKRAKKALKVSWKKDKKATKYQIVIATNKSFTKNKKVITVKKSKTSYTIKKLKKNKKYFVKVRSIRRVNKKNYYGKYSAVKKTKTK